MPEDVDVGRRHRPHHPLGHLLALHAQHVDPIDTGTLVDIFRDDPHASLLGTDALRDGVQPTEHLAPGALESGEAVLASCPIDLDAKIESLLPD